MPDREKVIRAIEYCLAGCSEKCPYFFSEYCLSSDGIENKSLLRDALELLKAQEPRVMTFEEVNGMQWDYCYVEDEVMMDKVQRMMYGTHRIHCITWPSIASYKMSYGENGYGKRWRCWTQKPTDEQRKAVKWDA